MRQHTDEFPTGKSNSPSEPELDDLEIALEKLGYLTHSLAFFSNLVSWVTLVHVVFAVFLIISIILAIDVSPYSSFYLPRSVLILIEVLFLVVSVILLLAYDRRLAKGEGLYQEISDELEWHVRRDPSSKVATVPDSRLKDRPGLSVRLVLRDFVLSSRLPFMRGAQGIFTYFSLNIALTLTTLLAFAFKVTRP